MTYLDKMYNQSKPYSFCSKLKGTILGIELALFFLAIDLNKKVKKWLNLLNERRK